MATKLYFHDLAQTSPGTLPASNATVSATTPSQIGDSGTNRSMDNKIGTSQTSKSITTSGGAAQPSLIARFVSRPLAAQTFALTGVGDISLSIAGSEANAGSNFQVRISLATWRPSTGAVVTRIHDLATNATLEPGTSQTSLTATNAAGGTSATIASQDVLICEIWRDSTVPGAATARVNTIFYDGTTEASTTTNAAFINFPNDTLIFAPSGFAQAQASIKAIGVESFAQAQAFIPVKAGYAQAQGYIKAIDVNRFAQAQTFIRSKTAYSQAAALINGSFFLPFTETFTRSVTDGLGTSDNGDTWTFIGGVVADADVNGSTALLTQSGASSTTYDLKSTLIKSDKGLNIVADFSIDKIPSTNGANLFLGLDNTAINIDLVETGFQLRFNPDGNINVYPYINNAGLVSPPLDRPYAINDIWRIHFQVFKTTFSVYSRIKAWKIGTTEPDWIYFTASDDFGPLAGHPKISFGGANNANNPIVISLDNFAIQETSPSYWAQAQALITSSKNGFAQAQTFVRKLAGYGQASAIIARDYNAPYFIDTFTRSVTDGLGSADAGNVWNRVFGTAANADVDGSKLVYQTSEIASEYHILDTLVRNESGFELKLSASIDQRPFIDPYDITLSIIGYNSTSLTARFRDVGQVSTAVGSYNNANAGGSAMTTLFTAGVSYIFRAQFIKTSEEKVAVYTAKPYPVGGTETPLSFEAAYAGTLPVGKIVLDFGTSGDPAYVVTVDNITITETGTKQYGQAQAYIKAIDVNKSAQAQSWIKQTYNGFAQAQTTVKQTYNGFAQAQTQVKQTYNAFAQAQATILSGTRGYAQAQAHIKQTYQGYAQAQTDVKQTYNGFAQAQGWIKITRAGYAQAQAQIILIRRGLAHAQALIDTGLYTASDTFTRVSASGWGTADVGGSWNHFFSSSPGDSDHFFTVTGTEGTGNPDGDVVSKLDSVTSQRIVYGKIKFKVNATTTSPEIVYLHMVNPSNNDRNTSYPSAILGGVEIVQNGTITIVGRINNFYKINVTSPITFTPNTYYWIAVESLQTSSNIPRLRVKFWADGSTETGWIESLDEEQEERQYFGSPAVSVGSNINQKLFTVDNYEFGSTGWTETAQAQAYIKAIDIPKSAQAQALIAKLVGYDDFNRTAVGISFDSWGTASSGNFGWGEWTNGSGAPVSHTTGTTGAAGDNDSTSIVGYPLIRKGMVQFDFKTPASLDADFSSWRINVDSARDIASVVKTGIIPTATLDVETYFGDSFTGPLFELDTWYTFRYTISDVTLTKIALRVWKRSDPMPNAYFESRADNPGSAFGTVGAAMLVAGNSTTSDTEFDNFFFWTTEEPLAWRRYALARTWIKTTANRSAQAQAFIVYTQQGVAQAQAKIQGAAATVLNAFAQAQTQIKTTYQGYAQAQTDVKQTYQGYAQGQADIKQTYQGYANAQTDIKQTYNGFAQAQTDIKQTYQGYAQSQADIKQTYVGCAQAQADIKQTYNGFGQAQVWIEQTYNAFAQSQAWIENTYVGCANAQAQIKQTYQGYANAQADIKQTYTAFAQAQAQVIQTYQGYAQSQAWIETTHNGFGQAQSDIKQTYQGYAQAGAWIENTYNGFGQAQVWIENTYVGCGQAQADIKTTYNGFAQAQAKINAFAVKGYAQAQANIRFNGTQAYSQAQAKLRAFGVKGYAQSQADIKAIGRGFAQAQADILVTTNRFAQAQAWIENTYNGFAQAQARIKQTYNLSAQAQADVKQTYKVHSQAQADIKAVSVACGQAQTLVAVTSQRYAQAQGAIKATSVGSGQAQSDIKQTYNSFAQSQADIKSTYSGYAQANAYIIISGITAAAQAQTSIITTYTGSGQAQTGVQQTYVAHGQAQCLIKVTVNNVSQAQASIATYIQGYAQAQAVILSGRAGYAQAQAHILVEGNTGYAQAQASIVKGAGYGQAQAFIVISHYLHRLEISDTTKIHLTLSDRAVESDELTESTITLILSDRAF